MTDAIVNDVILFDGDEAVITKVTLPYYVVKFDDGTVEKLLRHEFATKDEIQE